ncbi:MAG: energy transducer TonB, partial [Myxococcota bacterium]
TLALDGSVEVALDPTLEENLDALFTDLSRTPTERGGTGLFGAPRRGSNAQADDEPREATEVDEPPRVRRRIPARYPLQAEREGITGYVVLRGLVERDGRMSRVTVVDAQPRGVFEEAARRAFSRWQFSPGRHNRKAVRVWVRKRLEFTLR